MLEDNLRFFFLERFILVLEKCISLSYRRVCFRISKKFKLQNKSIIALYIITLFYLSDLVNPTL